MLILNDTFLFGDPQGEWYTLTYNPRTEQMTRKAGYRNEERSVACRALEPEPAEADFQSIVALSLLESDCLAEQRPCEDFFARISLLGPDVPDAVALFGMAQYDLTAGIKGLLNIGTWKSGESNG